MFLTGVYIRGVVLVQQQRFLKGTIIGAEVYNFGMDNVAWVPWPYSFNPPYSETRGKEKLPFLILVFATMFITLCKFYANKFKFSYKDVKYSHLFLKTRRSYNRHKMLLIVPKIIFFYLLCPYLGGITKTTPLFK